MRNDFDSNDSLPKLASEKKINAQNDVPDIDNNNFKGSTNNPKPDYTSLDSDDMTLGNLLDTINLTKIQNNIPKMEAPTNKTKVNAKTNLFIVFSIILCLLGIAFLVYVVFKPSEKKEIKNNPDNLSSTNLISKKKYAANDEEAYQSQILTTVNNKVFMFDPNGLVLDIKPNVNQRVYLYIDQNQNLKIMLAREQTVVTPRVVGYKVSGFDYLVANILPINNPCDNSLAAIYVLTTEGDLYYIDINKMRSSGSFVTVYNQIKSATLESAVDLELVRIESTEKVKSLTNIYEPESKCDLYPYVLLTNGEMKMIEDHAKVGKRYFGQIGYLKLLEKIDYYIYLDKTISTVDGNIISDVNGQNYKFEKVLFANNNLPINNITSPYIFISTDNKLITVDTNDLLKIDVSTQEVTNVVENTLTKEDNVTQITNYTIFFKDGQTKEISAPDGINLINIQDLIN